MTYMEALQNRIDSLCRQRRFSINKLANMSGLRQSTVDSIMKGKAKNTTLRTVGKLANGFSMTVSEFLDFPEMNAATFSEEE